MPNNETPGGEGKLLRHGRRLSSKKRGGDRQAGKRNANNWQKGDPRRNFCSKGKKFRRKEERRN